ncbi:hypothetical protein [Azospirillum sp. B2RO_4]|uniref:hypothetical protein n=1 Tax=Azospirillum sp. B2RO_4 TaxID=3027796 RepID=UPI003DA94748
MLTGIGKREVKRARIRRKLKAEKSLWDNPRSASGSLGCAVCPDKELCGGLSIESSLLDCLQFCCGNPENCDRVCRNHHEFADRVREVGTFELNTVPRAPKVYTPELPRVVPIIYHRSRRIVPPNISTVALSLYSLFSARTGLPRFSSHEEVCEKFCIPPGAQIVLTGTNKDPPLEKWWGLGEELRKNIIIAMKNVGVSIVTTPNYSLFIDRPRWDDMHSMKRIAIVHEEFIRFGLPAALHINARTERDFERWGDYIKSRDEISHLAYEFTTGTGWPGRRKAHAEMLTKMVNDIGRPLNLLVRGGVDLLPDIAKFFDRVTSIDSSAFMRTMMRHKAYPKGNSEVSWVSSPTEPEECLDDIFFHNVEMTRLLVSDMLESLNSRKRD